MKRVIAGVVLIGLLASLSYGADINPLEPIDHRTIACGCTFHRIEVGGPVGIPNDAEKLVVLDVNGDPPHAFINLGSGNQMLAPESEIEFPLYQCSVGSRFRSSWMNDEVELKLDLVAEAEGLEACWFEGEISVSGINISDQSSVRGAWRVWLLITHASRHLPLS